MFKWLRILIVVGIICGFLTMTIGCEKKTEQPAEKKTEQPAKPAEKPAEGAK